MATREIPPEFYRAAFGAESGFATANGRPQRDAIWQAHAHALDTTLETQ